jgi:hypothetical protein
VSLDLGGGSNGKDPVSPNGDRLGSRLRCIHGDDVSPAQDQLRFFDRSARAAEDQREKNEGGKTDLHGGGE